MDCKIISISQLSILHKMQIFELAYQCSSVIVQGHLQPLFGRYSRVALAYENDKLTAVQFIDTVKLKNPLKPTQLIYIGPTFSRKGGYLALFKAIIARQFERQEAFLLCAEVESIKILRDMAALLPCLSYPAPNSKINSAIAIQTILSFTQHFDHIKDFNPSDFTTKMTHSLQSTSVSVAARYHVITSGWDGSKEQQALWYQEIGLPILAADYELSCAS